MQCSRGTQGYLHTVTPVVCSARLDTQEQVFSADSYTFIQEQHHKKPTLLLQLSLSIKNWLYNIPEVMLLLFQAGNRYILLCITSGVTRPLIIDAKA